MDYLEKQFRHLLKQIVSELQQLNESIASAVETYHANQDVNRRPPVIEFRRPQAEVNEEEAHHRRQEAHNERIIYIQTAGLMVSVVVGIAALLSAISAQQGAKAARQSAQAALKQAKAAEETITVTQRSIQTNIDNFKLDQRAWVGPVSADPFSITPNAGTIFGITITNSGKTPALKMTSDFMAHYMPKAKPLVFIYTKPRGLRSADTLQPNMRMSLTSPNIVLSPPQVNALKDGTSILYVYGKIAYSDVFNASHFTTFCMYVEPNLRSLSSCNVYNTAN